MQFIKVHAAPKRGDGPEPVLVAISDISNVKPTSGRDARTIISLRSSPDFAVWAHETFAQVEDMLNHLGADVVPHG